MDVGLRKIVRAAMTLAHETGGISMDAMDAMLERPEMGPEDLEILAMELDRAAARLRASGGAPGSSPLRLAKDVAVTKLPGLSSARSLARRRLAG